LHFAQRWLLEQPLQHIAHTSELIDGGSTRPGASYFDTFCLVIVLKPGSTLALGRNAYQFSLSSSKRA
jgi:hypothetical protein